MSKVYYPIKLNFVITKMEIKRHMEIGEARYILKIFNVTQSNIFNI